MFKKNQIFLFCTSFVVLATLFIACERDDICAENVTPYLIIRFKDIEDPDTAEDIVDLQIQYIGTNLIPGDTTKFVFSSAITTDSITLLLPTFKNTATFKFIQNYDTAIDDETGDIVDDLSDAEIDTVEFTYNATEEYVNRACGFRVLYSGLDAEVTEGDGAAIIDGFIKSKDIINENINNEEEAHIHFLH